MRYNLYLYVQLAEQRLCIGCPGTWLGMTRLTAVKISLQTMVLIHVLCCYVLGFFIVYSGVFIQTCFMINGIVIFKSIDCQIKGFRFVFNTIDSILVKGIIEFAAVFECVLYSETSLYFLLHKILILLLLLL